MTPKRQKQRCPALTSDLQVKLPPATCLTITVKSLAQGHKQTFRLGLMLNVKRNWEYQPFNYFDQTRENHIKVCQLRVRRSNHYTEVSALLLQYTSGTRKNPISGPEY